MRHGEFKAPGGKLVVADIQVDDGEIAHAELSGDFFLEPPEALAAMRDALVGAPATSSIELLTERVSRAVPASAVMLGFSPGDVAEAVRRALA
ncbi:MAG TPA: hypothetical protein VKA00_01170 [Trueperaceae bacterium]|nr:hypothetical protein [Trueperaceae bacterium]